MLSKKTVITWIFCIQNRAYVAEIVWEIHFGDIPRELVDTKPEEEIRSDLSHGSRKNPASPIATWSFGSKFITIVVMKLLSEMLDFFDFHGSNHFGFLSPAPYIVGLAGNAKKQVVVSKRAFGPRFL